MDHNRVKSFLLGNGCDYFHFRMNVPKASHMGGSWERLIRTVRNVLTPMLEKIGTQLDDDTIHTLFYEVAAIVNSRPLSVCDLYDPLSSGILTPNQLITMKTKIVLPPPGNFTQPDLYSRKRWRRIQYVLNIFWSKWKTEYLTELQNRKKWKFPKRDMKPGDIVLLKEDDQHRNAWPIAIVDDVYPSEDGHIRKVKLRVADSHINDKGVRVKSQSVLERPIHKCVLLMETD